MLIDYFHSVLFLYFLASNPSWKISPVNNDTFKLVSKFDYKGKLLPGIACLDDTNNLIEGSKSITSIQNLVQDVRWTSDSLRRYERDRKFTCWVTFSRKDRSSQYFEQVFTAEGFYITHQHSNFVGMFLTFSLCKALIIIHSIEYRPNA